jgi:hypothetical protein
LHLRDRHVKMLLKQLAKNFHELTPPPGPPRAAGFLPKITPCWW